MYLICVNDSVCFLCLEYFQHAAWRVSSFTNSLALSHKPNNWNLSEQIRYAWFVDAVLPVFVACVPTSKILKYYVNLIAAMSVVF